MTPQERLAALYDRVDAWITRTMAKYALDVLRIGLGVIFFWFGAMKLVPGMSPAEELVKATVPFVHPWILLPVLALVEVAIGLGLILGRNIRLTLLLLFLQMPGTALPMLLLPDVVWTTFPVGLTLEGQYIVKNLVLVGAALAIGASVRDGDVAAERAKANAAEPPSKDEIVDGVQAAMAWLRTYGDGPGPTGPKSALQQPQVADPFPTIAGPADALAPQTPGLQAFVRPEPSDERLQLHRMEMLRRLGAASQDEAVTT